MTPDRSTHDDTGPDDHPRRAHRAVTAAMSLARDERADLLTTLTPAQWETPSLCAQWRVKDVVAHMFSYEELGIGGLLARFLTGGVLPDRVNAAGVAA
jgi:uncharacterized protein (TIGR03083 family)